jgi:glycosyltransferase involved in cell wall biosynthesis
MMDERGRITVLQLCEHFGGREASLHGVARSFQWWIPAFDPARFRVLLCSRKGRDKAAEQMEAAGLRPLYLGYHRLDPRNLLKLLSIARAEGVDLIHAHGYGACTWGRIAGIRLRVPVIVHERCNTHTVPLFQRPVERLLGPRTRFAFAVSESSRRFCIEKRYMRADAVHVLYNGILMDDIVRRDQAWVQRRRAEEGARPGERIVGIVGRLESHRGHIDAFRALLELREAMPDLRLWVVGDGTFAGELRRWVREHGLDGRVRFLGFRRDVRDLIQVFDVQLFPSHMEGTPNTLYEALAVGHAIVASTADGQGEILEHGRTALLFDPGDYVAMADLLRRVLEDPALAARLRRSALERAADFDGRETIRTMEQAYEALAGGG